MTLSFKAMNNPTSPVAADNESTFVTEVITSIEGLAALEKEWATFLDQGVIERRFAQDPAIIRNHIHLDPTRRSPLIVVFKNQNGDIKCIAPCVIETGKFKLQFSVIRLPSPKARILKIYGNALIFAPDVIQDHVIKCFFDLLTTRMNHFDYLYFDNLSVNNPLWNYIQHHFSRPSKPFLFSNASPKMEKVRFTKLPESYDAWINSMGKKKRYNMKRTTRLLQEAFNHNVKLECVTDPEQVQSFLDQLDTLYNKTWQAKSMGHWARNSAEQLRYFTEIAKNKWLRSYLLKADQKPIAFLVAYQYCDVLEYMELGYDPEFSPLSPGGVLNNLLFEDLFAHNPPKILDFGFGENQYKRVLGNADYDACAAYLTPPGKWRFVVSLQLVLNKVYSRIHGFLVKYGWDKRVRQLLKLRN